MLKHFRNIRIRNKLLLAYALSFCVVFSIAGGFVYSQVREIIQSSIRQNLTRTTEGIRSMVRTNADVAIRNYLRAVAEKNYDIANQLYRQVKRGRISEEEAKKRARDAFIHQTLGKTGFIYCLNSKGSMVLHPKRYIEGLDLSSLSFVKEQIRKKNGYLEYEWREPLEKSKRPKAISMTYFKPWDWIITASTYRDEFNTLIKTKDFRKNILELGFGKSGYPFVLNYDGVLLIHPFLENKHYSSFGDPRLSEVARRIITERNGHFDYEWRNPGEEEMRRKVVYFRDIPELGWVVASSSYYEDFYAPLNATQWVIITSAIMAVMLMVPISLWIGSMITRPLKALQGKLAQAAGGDFSVRMERNTKDELGIMAGYFNYFMEKLTEFNDSLREEIAVRKAAEEKLIAHDKARTMFLSAASHELRTPLTSIIGFLKLMEREFNKHFRPNISGDKDTDRRVERYMKNITVVRSEADRLGRLVNDLLDLNKIESGRMEWRDEKLQVSDVLINAAEAISAYNVSKPEVEFSLGNTDGLGTIHADADRIHQVLINLLNNAFKYTDSGLVSLAARRSEGSVHFVVTDTGRGITEEDQTKVFDIFYQVQDVNRRSSKVFGTGLGLAICQQISTHYGGSLSVTSEIGKGSAFTFTMPQNSPPSS